MPRNGYLALARKQFGHVDDGGCPWWHEPRELSKWEAWVDMIQSAAWAPYTRICGGRAVEIERGETPPRSVRFLAARFGWSRKRVERWLADGQRMDRFVRHQSTPDGDTYLVVNYEAYQSTGDSQETGSETARRQPEDSQETKEKKSNKSKKSSTPPVIPPKLVEAIPDFEDRWRDRLAAATKRPTPTGERYQLRRLVELLDERGPGAVKELVEDVTAGGYQGLKKSWLSGRGSSDRGRPDSTVVNQEIASRRSSNLSTAGRAAEAWLSRHVEELTEEQWRLWNSLTEGYLHDDEELRTLFLRVTGEELPS